MQIHFVSYNTKYPDILTSLSHSDGLAVLGVFLQVGASFHSQVCFHVPYSFPKVATCKVIRIPELRRFLPVESGMHQIFLLESRIPVPLTKNLESRTWNTESTASNSEFKTISDFLAWGDKGINCIV